jgi:DivIVA domain-containing protein
MDLTPQSITAETVKAVQFREKLRGYHPDDVDAFVASVAAALEQLEQSLRVAESKASELESRSSAANEAEDSLRRTLVLAQRTADLAIQEAREEASRVLTESHELRTKAEQELAELRARLQNEAEEESRDERARLVAERAALQVDVDALETHLSRERERLRIYFTDQLRRVDEGEPGLAARPEMQAQVAEPDPDPEHESDAEVVAAGDDAADDGAVDGDDNGQKGDGDGEDDPFLAELRRAVNDDQPLGPRDHVVPAADGEGDDDAFDLFARGDDDAGRFGFRRRR